MSERENQGYFGLYGGRYVGETLVAALDQLEEGIRNFFADDSFWSDYHILLNHYVGRPSPIWEAKRLTETIGTSCRLFLKREDLNHTGSHKINNTIGQVLLAHRMGKREVIAETGAGQHGVATATVAALFGMKCKVFMGAEDVRRQAPNVRRMELLGTEVVSIQSGNATLKDAMNEALRYWSEVSDHTFYVVGTVAGPAPYPRMVREFQKIIGIEARTQMLELTGKLPSIVIAAVGGGSNAMGIFHAMIDDPDIELIGVEAGGKGSNPGEHCASLNRGRIGVLHGMKTMILQDEDGQIDDGYSISAGLDYPGVGPEHALLQECGRVRYEIIDDQAALEAFYLLCKFEGIIPALESSHAVAQAIREAKRQEHRNILINLSGRGDKDVDHVLARTAPREETDANMTRR
jgi:tryptophan synthase beta chain